MNKKILHSFDIFDTLITRNCIDSNGIFLIMENILKSSNTYSCFPSLLKDNFYIIRKESEKFARENEKILHNKKEITFDDIYKIIQNNYNLSDVQTASLKSLEINIEQKNLAGINENICKVKKCIQKGEYVILISDMYFSENILKQFLVNLDPIFTNIKIYTSADCNLSKRKGLYKHIHNDYPMIEKWFHIGDNFFSDIFAAKINDINAIHYKHQKTFNYEKYVLNKEKNNYKFKLIYGCSKKLCMNNKNTKYQFGCSFAGPLLYNYTKWILQQCVSNNIKNIYFVSRDGYIIKKIADLLILENKLDITPKYFYSSRIASRIITENNYDNFIEFIFNEQCIATKLDRILNSLNITYNELLDFVPSKIIKKNNLLKQVLLKNQDLRILIVKKNKSKLNLFKEYLKQEIPENCEKIAFVDVNGSGRTQDITAEILNMITPCKIYNFYLNLAPTMQQKSYSIKCSYNPSSNFQDDWIEILCRCTEGQTLGYKKQKNEIIPIKEFECSKYIIEWGFEDYIKGILDYAYSMNEIEKINNIDVNSISLYMYMFEFIQTKLDKNTADILGSIPFDSYGAEKNLKECAPKLNLLNIFKPGHKDYISVARCSLISKPFWQITKFIISPKTYGYISKDKKSAYLKFFKFKIDITSLIWGNKV